jgi:hypothetical protein
VDRRYKSSRWRRVRLIVLARDSYRCYVQHCMQYANHCDHINAVYPGMPDSEFFGPHNLRASCRRHNTARGVAARLEREVAEGVAPAPTRTVFERSFKTAERSDRPIPKSLSLSRYTTITADYTRKSEGVA